VDSSLYHVELSDELEKTKKLNKKLTDCRLPRLSFLENDTNLLAQIFTLQSKLKHVLR
jgi:hypothetical protein